MFHELPTDIHTELSQFCDINELKKIVIVSKNMNVYKNYLNKLKNACSTISLYYSKNNPFRIYENDEYDPNFKNKITKNIDIRVRTANYKLNHFQIYPELLVQKCSNVDLITNENKNILLEYIANNLNTDKNKRTRRELRQFLLLPQITIKHLNFTGW